MLTKPGLLNKPLRTVLVWRLLVSAGMAGAALGWVACLLRCRWVWARWRCG
jgi:hypothetical protein